MFCDLLWACCTCVTIYCITNLIYSISVEHISKNNNILITQSLHVFDSQGGSFLPLSSDGHQIHCLKCLHYVKHFSTNWYKSDADISNISKPLSLG